jgi:hypothetical protein
MSDQAAVPQKVKCMALKSPTSQGVATGLIYLMIVDVTFPLGCLRQLTLHMSRAKASPPKPPHPRKGPLPPAGSEPLGSSSAALPHTHTLKYPESDPKAPPPRPQHVTHVCQRLSLSVCSSPIRTSSKLLHSSAHTHSVVPTSEQGMSLECSRMF